MKKILFLLFVTLQLAQAQKIDKYIKEEDVTRIISTLASDDMNGRSAMDEKSITKAADFIEKEFKDIGLKPLTGSTGFLQEFSIYEKLETTRLNVLVDGRKIPNDDVILYSDATTIKLDQSRPVQQIDKEKPFRASLRPYFSDTIAKVVFVAPEHEKEFHQIRGYLSGSRLIEKGKTKKGAIVFVLGNPSASFSVDANQKISPFKMMNVVGVLEGRKSRKEEIVVFSSHYDHLGFQHTITDGIKSTDSIANGADDDASGTTAVIELARYFKKAKKNKRTLIFAAFTAEEVGGYGSKYFSKQLNPDKVMAMFNIEMIGKPSKWGQNTAFITGYEKSDFGEILQRNLAGTQFQFKPDPYLEQNLFYRSDNATLARLGVPAHTISTDEIDIDKFYHTVDDEVETLNMKNITFTIKAIALSSKTIVDGTDTPKRIDKSKVN